MLHVKFDKSSCSISFITCMSDLISLAVPCLGKQLLHVNIIVLFMSIGLIRDVNFKKWQPYLVEYKGLGLPLSSPEPHSDQQWLEATPIWLKPALTTEWDHGNLITSVKPAFSSVMLNNLRRLLRGDMRICHSRMTKTCWETLVTCLWKGPSINYVHKFTCYLDPLPPFLHVISNRNV